MDRDRQSAIMSEKKGKKRKRIKLRYLVKGCSGVFNDDFRSEHNRKHHSALVEAKSSIPYEEVGAPKADTFFGTSSSSKTFQDRTEGEQQDDRVETRVEVRKSSLLFLLLS